jgi:hypothetical protein
MPERSQRRVVWVGGLDQHDDERPLRSVSQTTRSPSVWSRRSTTSIPAYFA